MRRIGASAFHSTESIQYMHFLHHRNEMLPWTLSMLSMFCAHTNRLWPKSSRWLVLVSRPNRKRSCNCYSHTHTHTLTEATRREKETWKKNTNIYIYIRNLCMDKAEFISLDGFMFVLRSSFIRYIFWYSAFAYALISTKNTLSSFIVVAAGVCSQMEKCSISEGEKEM